MEKLTDICDIQYGYAFDSACFTEDSSYPPLVRIRDVKRGFSETYYSGEYPEEYVLHAGDLLVGMDGEFNIARWKSIDALLNQRVCKLTAKVGTNEEYLRFAMVKALKTIEDKTAFVTVKHLSAKELNKLELDIPCIEEQNLRADSLSKLEKIISLREDELRQLDDLIKARFVEMFGDPMVNPKGYKIQKYGELFELNAGGTPSKTVPEYWENGTISWIGSNMCQNVILYENDGKYISQDGYDHSSARLFPVDTVLIALVGATIGKTALLKFETSTNQNVLGVRHIVESGYNPMFVFYYTQFLYQKFMNIGDGGFNMASKGFVSELPMYDVDLSVQNEFATFANQVDKSKVAVQKSLDETQQLFDSLMQQYFG